MRECANSGMRECVSALVGLGPASWVLGQGGKCANYDKLDALEKLFKHKKTCDTEVPHVFLKSQLTNFRTTSPYINWIKVPAGLHIADIVVLVVIWNVLPGAYVGPAGMDHPPNDQLAFVSVPAPSTVTVALLV